VHSNSLHSWYGWAVAALLRRPHLWHAREIVVQSRAALVVERLLTRRFATRVLCVSEPVAAQLPDSPTVVVHDAVDDDEGFSPLRAGSFRPKVGIADDDSVLGAAGRIDTWKGFDLLLAAVEGLRRRRPDLQVVIAGGPVAGKQDYAEALAERAKGLPGVHWLGPRQDMPELLADLDVFVLPSTEPEPFSAVALEALASGVPVAASAHGGSPEMLKAIPPSSAALFEPRNAASLVDAVLSILLPPGTSSTDQRRARRRYMVGDPDDVVRFFDRVLSGPGDVEPPNR
jgi:glycosyltransferase involved in cell wall biosynthesis